MSDDSKKDLNKILSDMGDSVSKLAKGVIDLAKVGAGKAQEAVEDYQSKSKAKDSNKGAKKAKKAKEEPKDEQ